MRRSKLQKRLYSLLVIVLAHHTAETLILAYDALGLAAASVLPLIR